VLAGEAREIGCEQRAEKAAARARRGAGGVEQRGRLPEAAAAAFMRIIAASSMRRSSFANSAHAAGKRRGTSSRYTSTAS
jgi:hypothetical protein